MTFSDSRTNQTVQKEHGVVLYLLISTETELESNRQAGFRVLSCLSNKFSNRNISMFSRMTKIGLQYFSIFKHDGKYDEPLPPSHG